MLRFRIVKTFFALSLSILNGLFAQNQPKVLNQPLDISPDFYQFENTLFFADSLVAFDPETGEGKIRWIRNEVYPAHAFNHTQIGFRPTSSNEFPAIEYEQNPVLSFKIDFTSSNTFRIRALTGKGTFDNSPSLMLARNPEHDKSWQYKAEKGRHVYSNSSGKIILHVNPWAIEIQDKNGRRLTKTRTINDGETTFTHPLPFSFVRRAHDYSRSVAAAFSIAPDEKFFGTGESFTKPDKNGQKVVLYVSDPNGVETSAMYKPIPFYFSDRGYGIFMHTSSPITCDFGHQFGESNTMFIGDENLDLFIFLGEPKTILNEYTNLTGKASVPPLWSFGLWMSRITYFSEQDGRNVAALLRKNRIPADVIHFDTGWFETDWRSDFKFAPGRFQQPEKMIADLKNLGFRTSLWQLPYFVPKNHLYDEIVSKGLTVKNANGTVPYEDAILDLSNPNAVKWYREKLGGLLKAGVGAIKVDFGEAAPLKGLYASGKTGFYEHNLYPLRYNKLVADLTNEITGNPLIWARSTWAGSQRYPVHWGGDAETTDKGMEAQLWGGLSLGLSGFTFWSHDVGGFTKPTPEELYRRWLPFGALSSHTRAHGQAPKEPWEYNENFQNYFRKVIEMRYQLMPYIYAQSVAAAETGLPLLRPLFLEYPSNPGAWHVYNQYMLGTDVLVAPIFEKGTKSRKVYLPENQWIDYQTGTIYEPGWHEIQSGELEIIMMVKEGAVIPHVDIAQSTDQIDWSTIKLKKFGNSVDRVTVDICLPIDNQLKKIILQKNGKRLSVVNDPFNGNVKWAIQ